MDEGPQTQTSAVPSVKLEDAKTDGNESVAGFDALRSRTRLRASNVHLRSGYLHSSYHRYNEVRTMLRRPPSRRQAAFRPLCRFMATPSVEVLGALLIVRAGFPSLRLGLFHSWCSLRWDWVRLPADDSKIQRHPPLHSDIPKGPQGATPLNG